jgi:predicted lipase
LNFNPQLALRCAESLRALYRGDVASTIANVTTDTQVRIEEAHAGEFVILFPGSVGAKDWLTNARVALETWDADEFAKVHRGFARAFWSVKTDIFRAVQHADRLIIAGHSLGGALATLCADALVSFGHAEEIHRVITFGSPRVGNPGFAANYNTALDTKTQRVVNAGDPVPHIPWLLGRYRHVDTQVYLQRDGEVRIDEPLRVAVQEIKHTFTTVQQQHAALFGASHGIDAYIGKLKGLK